MCAVGSVLALIKFLGQLPPPCPFDAPLVRPGEQDRRPTRRNGAANAALPAPACCPCAPAMVVSTRRRSESSVPRSRRMRSRSRLRAAFSSAASAMPASWTLPFLRLQAVWRGEGGVLAWRMAHGAWRMAGQLPRSRAATPPHPETAWCVPHGVRRLQQPHHTALSPAPPPPPPPRPRWALCPPQSRGWCGVGGGGLGAAGVTMGAAGVAGGAGAFWGVGVFPHLQQLATRNLRTLAL
jgi:hypothetical protein